MQLIYTRKEASSFPFHLIFIGGGWLLTSLSSHMLFKYLNSHFQHLFHLIFCLSTSILVFNISFISFVSNYFNNVLHYHQNHYVTPFFHFSVEMMEPMYVFYLTFLGLSWLPGCEHMLINCYPYCTWKCGIVFCSVYGKIMLNDIYLRSLPFLLESIYCFFMSGR